MKYDFIINGNVFTIKKNQQSISLIIKSLDDIAEIGELTIKTADHNGRMICAKKEKNKIYIWRDDLDISQIIDRKGIFEFTIEEFIEMKDAIQKNYRDITHPFNFSVYLSQNEVNISNNANKQSISMEIETFNEIVSVPQFVERELRQFNQVNGRTIYVLMINGEIHVSKGGDEPFIIPSLNSFDVIKDKVLSTCYPPICKEKSEDKVEKYKVNELSVHLLVNAEGEITIITIDNDKTKRGVNLTNEMFQKIFDCHKANQVHPNIRIPLFSSTAEICIYKDKDLLVIQNLIEISIWKEKDKNPFNLSINDFYTIKDIISNHNIRNEVNVPMSKKELETLKIMCLARSDDFGINFYNKIKGI